LGRRYTPEEIQQIQALIDEGLTNREIATKLDRSKAGIRNIRHRIQLTVNTQKSLQSLIHEEKEVNKRVFNIKREIASLKTRRRNLLKILDADEKTLNLRLQVALEKLKGEKPELFEISLQEQIGKIAAEFTINFLKWVVS